MYRRAVTAGHRETALPSGALVNLMPAATTDATTLGQLVILAGLLITALTQIALAFINRRAIETRADALAAKVELTAADLKVDRARADLDTRELVQRNSEEVKTAAQKAYTEANTVNEKLSRLTAVIDRRFDGLVTGSGEKVREE